jgi:hypothetical protein
MKREKLEINKNSKKLEINNISNILFSNKNNKRITMKLEVTKTYKIGDLTFESLEAANLHILKSIYDTGLEEIIRNPENFITALRAVTNPGNPEKSTSNLGKQPDLSDISKYLKEKENITITRLSTTTRKASDWPVYIAISPLSTRAFRYTGKVHQLYYEILETSIEEIISKYSYKL